AAGSGSLDIGADVGSTGTVTLIGAGTAWSNISQSVVAGDAGTGSLTVENGALVNVETGYVGNYSGSVGAITVTGAGSEWTSSYLGVGSFGQGMLTVKDGGAVNSAAGGTFGVGIFPGSSGSVVVTGTSSQLNVSSWLLVGPGGGTGSLTIESGGTVNSGGAFLGGEGPTTTGTGAAFVRGIGSQWNTPFLEVGSTGSGTLLIQDGGIVNSGGSSLGTFEGGSGSATVSGAGAEWITSNLYVGLSGPGTLTVNNGGVVTAGILQSPGTITIGTSGTVSADGGTLQGTVINHGTLDPLGTITINGDYTQGVDGTLILDVAGTGLGDFGQLDVSGNATFNGTLDFDFIDGFAPAMGDSFDFINVMGSADLSGATIDIGG
ncbi:MAG: hypothetical protein ACRD2G_07955, partial [Terriglobia bacterium]